MSLLEGRSLDELVASHVVGDREPQDDEVLAMAWIESPSVRESLAAQQRIDRLLLAARPHPLDLDRLMAALPPVPGHADAAVMQALPPARPRAIVRRPFRLAAAMAAVCGMAFGLDGMDEPPPEGVAQSPSAGGASVTMPSTAAPALTGVVPEGAAAPAPSAATVVPLDWWATGDSLLRFDFEKRGEADKRWITGRIVDCPPGSAGRSCLRAARMRDSRYPNQFGVTLGDWNTPLFDVTGGETLTFSYWVGQSTGRDPTITVDLHGDGGRTYKITVPTAGRVRWVRVAVPVSAARWYHEPTRGLAVGERVRAVHLTVRWSDNDLFLVDDVSISRAPLP